MTKDIVKEVLDVIELTESEIRSENREYNASEWDRIISRYAKYENVKFYKAAPQRGYDYTRYYASYTVEGINFLGSVSYSSSLTNGGFARVEVISGKLYRTLLSDGKGNYGYGGTDKANREVMARNSQKYGVIYSKEF